MDNKEVIKKCKTYYKMLIKFINNLFDHIFVMLSLMIVLSALYVLLTLTWTIINDWLKLKILIEEWLNILILVKFYTLIKDYIWDHTVELKNLAEIWIVAIMSKLIFQDFWKEDLNITLVKILFLVVIIWFYVLETNFIKKK